MHFHSRRDTVFYGLGYTGNQTFTKTLEASGLDCVFVFDQNVEPPPNLGDFINGLNARYPDKPKFYWGHHGYAFPQHLTPPYNYFTLLRDPLDWHFGSFRYYAGLQKNTEADYDLYLQQNRLKNPNAYGLRFHLSVWPKEGSAPPLHTAIDIIAFMEKRFSFVGITEYFEECLLYVAWQMNRVLPKPWQRVSLTDTTTQNLTMTHAQAEQTRQQFAPEFAVYGHFAEKFSEGFERFLREQGLEETYLSYKAACLKNDARLLKLYRAEPDTYTAKYLPAFMRKNRQRTAFESLLASSHG